MRCLKPNNHKAPMYFESSVVLDQLRYTGMLETIKIRKMGYPVRVKFPAFIERYVTGKTYFITFSSSSEYWSRLLAWSVKLPWITNWICFALETEFIKFAIKYFYFNFKMVQNKIFWIQLDVLSDIRVTYIVFQVTSSTSWTTPVYDQSCKIMLYSIKQVEIISLGEWCSSLLTQ